MALSHASVTDLIGDNDSDGYLSQAYSALPDPDDLDRLLRRASELVDHYTYRPYEVDDDGLAVDTEVAEALRRATCAQVEQWIEVGEENSVDGLAGTARATGPGLRAPALAPRAYQALASIGLTKVDPTWPGEVLL